MELYKRGRQIYAFPLIKILYILCFMLFQPVNARDQIVVTKSDFEQQPRNLFYFRESEVVLYLESETNKLYRSEDEGKTWNLIKDIKDKNIENLIRHPFDNSKAIISTNGKKHYYTKDQGKRWNSFEAPIEIASKSAGFQFHKTESDYVIYLGSQCESGGLFDSEKCKDIAYYSIDFFKTSMNKLLNNVSTCKWAVSNDNEKLNKLNKKMIFCIKSNSDREASIEDTIDAAKLVWSTDFFNSQSLVDFDFDGIPDGGVIGFTILESFMIAAVRRDLKSDKLNLFVSTDGKVWAEAYLPKHSSLNQNAFTFLDSTNSSIALDVAFSSKDNIGALYFSNSNGTYFTQSLLNVNRDPSGIVDFERVKGVENIILSNVIKNPKDQNHKLISKISFNNGGKWFDIQPPNKDYNNKQYQCLKDKSNCKLHLHSVSSINNLGPVYSRKSARGILIGIGNVGNYLKDKSNSDTFFSKDGGLNWLCIRNGPHKFALADMGSILVLVEDKQDVKRIIYSYDLGNHWNEYKLNSNIQPIYLTSEKHSTSQSVLLIGETKQDKYITFHIDFSNLHERKCDIDINHPKDSKDLEIWNPKSPGDKGNLCNMGVQSIYYRRKSNVECFIGQKFKTIKMDQQTCACSKQDFECDYNYILDKDNKCILQGNILIPNGQCKNKKDKFMASSGYRKIPGNLCDDKKKDSVKLDKLVEMSCNITNNELPNNNNNNNNKIKHQRKEFSHSILGHFVFEDSENYMMYTINGELWTSIDAGTSWKKKIDSKVIKIIKHDYDSSIAYIITSDQNMLVTKDQGKTFIKMNLPIKVSTLKIDPVISFNPDEKDQLIFTGGTPCPKCYAEAYFSKDNGNNWKSISKYVQQCRFGITNEFTPNDKQFNILCSKYRNADNQFDQDKIELNKDSKYPLDLIIYNSDDLSKNKIILKDIGQYIISNQYIIASSTISQKITIQIAKSDFKFNLVKFPPNIIIPTDSFTIHENENSDGSSILLTLSKVSFKNSTEQPTFSTSKLPIGTLFNSNFNGSLYSLSLPNLRVNNKGMVDLQYINGIQGILVGNQITSVDENNNSITKTKMSFDNAATWNSILLTNGQDKECQIHQCYLHLHTQFENQNIKLGNFNSKGKILANGNIGQNLKSYDQSSTFFSKDNGLNWIKVNNSPSIYTMLDSANILFLIEDKPINYFKYSLDEGKNWSKFIFSNYMIKPVNVITNNNADSTRLLIIGYSLSKDANASNTPKSQIITVDFKDLFDRKCQFDNKEGKDFEKYIPQRLIKHEDKKAITSDCLLGNKLTFWRKKSNVNCYIGKNSDSQKIATDTCKCTELDFECDFNYWRSEAAGQCLLFGKDPNRPNNCKLGTKYKTKSGYRKISTSHCKGGIDLTKDIEKECLSLNGVEMKQTKFDSLMIQNFYFKQSSTLIVRTKDKQVYVSNNEGYSFNKLELIQDQKISDVLHHDYIDDTAYFITDEDVHYFTHDETRTMNSFKTPTKPNPFGIPVFSFHPDEPNWTIFTGVKDCDGTASSNCRAVTYLSKDNGSSWNQIAEYVKNCQFSKTKYLASPKLRIVCEKYDKEDTSQLDMVDSKVNLIVSDDEFKTSKILIKDIIGFSFFYEFMVVAENDKKNDGHLILNVSKDAKKFNQAKLPPNITITSDGFTVLESDTHSLFLHITSKADSYQGYGPLLISDSNGNDFTLSLDKLNRDQNGFVDFEKMAGIEGIALVNQVQDDKQNKLVSRITFNNGASWQPLKVRDKDSKGQKYECKDKECSLHLHSFTERSDPENIFSIPAAVGMMVGVGNYGKTLTDYEDGNTFFTNNAGKHWNEITKGPYRHEFADSGAIILLVKDKQLINKVKYSLDMGLSFKELEFPKEFEEIKVIETATEPQSTSQKLLIFGMTKDNQFITTFIDFSGLHDRKCVEDQDSSKSDFEPWSPSNVHGTKCFFGHELTYYRRKRDRKCYLDRKFKEPIKSEKPCECTELDFECDFNFIRDSNNKCILLPGLEPPKTSCDNNQRSYNISSGYRKIAMSHCTNGIDLSTQKQVWCPGHGLSGTSVFFIVFIPLLGLSVLIYGFIRRGRRSVDWNNIYNALSPILCFLPAILVELIYGQGRSSLSQRLFGTRGFRNNYDYEPVAQYDYDVELDDDFIDAPQEVNLDEDDEFQDFVNANSNEFDDEDLV